MRATGALRQRVVAALDASGIALHKNDDGSPAQMRIVAEDLARHVAVGPLRARFGADRDGAVLVVSPECSPLSAGRAIRAGANATVKSHLSSAYRKLGAGGRREATSLILEPDAGLLDVVFGAPPRGTSTPDVEESRAGRALPERTALLAAPLSSRDAWRILVN